MKQTRIKICGLRRLEDITYVNTVMPDFIGFIFDPSRRRWIEPSMAAVLRSHLTEGIQAVGVFVNENPDLILRISDTVGLDLIQLHGSEDENYIINLKKKTDRPIINAVQINTREDAAKAAASHADLILLDSGPGGTGKSFDWSLAKQIRRNFILAGGISAYNIKEAVNSCRPWGVDVSSSLETDGFKNFEKIKQFMKTVRETDSLTY